MHTHTHTVIHTSHTHPTYDAKQIVYRQSREHNDITRKSMMHGMILDVHDWDHPNVTIKADSQRPPEPNEIGLKDTVLVYPGEVTRLKMRFDVPGLFVWHCHILR